jgi:hypothetical protein
MDGKEIVLNTALTIKSLYQNREKEAIEQVAKLLPEYQSFLQELALNAGQEQTEECLSSVKDLIASYQAQDMLGMADNLKGRMLPMLQSYWG